MVHHILAKKFTIAIILSTSPVLKLELMGSGKMHLDIRIDSQNLKLLFSELKNGEVCNGSYV